MKIVQTEIKKLAEGGACVFVITHDYEFAAELFSSLLLLQEDGTIQYFPLISTSRKTWLNIFKFHS